MVDSFLISKMHQNLRQFFFMDAPLFSLYYAEFHENSITGHSKILFQYFLQHYEVILKFSSKSINKFLSNGQICIMGHYAKTAKLITSKK